MLFALRQDGLHAVVDGPNGDRAAHEVRGEPGRREALLVARRGVRLRLVELADVVHVAANAVENFQALPLPSFLRMCWRLLVTQLLQREPPLLKMRSPNGVECLPQNQEKLKNI